MFNVFFSEFCIDQYLGGKNIRHLLKIVFNDGEKNIRILLGILNMF